MFTTKSLLYSFYQEVRVSIDECDLKELNIYTGLDSKIVAILLRYPEANTFTSFCPFFPYYLYIAKLLAYCSPDVLLFSLIFWFLIIKNKNVTLFVPSHPATYALSL